MHPKALLAPALALALAACGGGSSTESAPTDFDGTAMTTGSAADVTSRGFIDAQATKNMHGDPLITNRAGTPPPVSAAGTTKNMHGDPLIWNRSTTPPPVTAQWLYGSDKVKDLSRYPGFEQ